MCDWRARCNRTIVATIVRPQPMRVKRCRHNDVTMKISFKALRRRYSDSCLRGAALSRVGYTRALSIDLTCFFKGRKGSHHKHIFFFLPSIFLFFQKWCIFLVGTKSSSKHLRAAEKIEIMLHTSCLNSDNTDTWLVGICCQRYQQHG